MRIVLDTNAIVSGVISAHGPPRRLIDAARGQVFQLCSSETLLAELLKVLRREKFSSRLVQAALDPRGIVEDLRRLAWVVTPPTVPRIVLEDPDDDHVLAAAIGSSADVVVSGDRHLLKLGSFNGIPIVSPRAALNIMKQL